LDDALRKAMEVEDNNEANIDKEASVNEEFRALAIPEISSQRNVLKLNMFTKLIRIAISG